MAPPAPPTPPASCSLRLCPSDPPALSAASSSVRVTECPSRRPTGRHSPMMAAWGDMSLSTKSWRWEWQAGGGSVGGRPGVPGGPGTGLPCLAPKPSRLHLHCGGGPGAGCQLFVLIDASLSGFTPTGGPALHPVSAPPPPPAPPHTISRPPGSTLHLAVLPAPLSTHTHTHTARRPTSQSTSWLTCSAC